MSKFASSIARIAKYRLIRSVIRGIVDSVKEGAENFYNFSKASSDSLIGYSTAVDKVKSATQVMKNQIGSAFGSLYAAIAPIILKLIEIATKLANVLTMLFARLSGAEGWYRAKEGADAAADAATGAGQAAKEAMKYLAPFDELNRLPSDNKNNGGGGTGSSSSGGGGYEWVDFDKFDIGDGIKDIVNWFTDAFRNMASWLENIDWQGLGSAFYTKLKETLTGIDWGALASSIFEFLGAALGAAVGFVAGIAEGIWEDIKTAFHNLVTNDDGTRKTGEEIFLGILEGIHNAVTNIGTWISEHILAPFVEGFCKAFGIASPAKEMEEPGKMVGEGILAGILKPFSNIGTWIKDNIVKPIKDWFTDNVVANVKIGVNLAKDGWSSVAKWVKDYIGDPVSKAIGLAKSGWTSVAAWVKKAIGGAVNKGIGLARDGWTSVASWIKDSFLGGAVKKAISISADFVGTATKAVQNFIDKWNALTDKKITIQAVADKFKETWNAIATKWNNSAFLRSIFTLPTLAGGGTLNAGQIFIARESGPEIVGQFGNRTGVMNNQQIVAAVSSGVANAIAGLRFSVSSAPQTAYVNNEQNEETLYRAMLRALNSADRQPIEIDIDGEPVYRGVVNRNRKETFRTGANPMLARG